VSIDRDRSSGGKFIAWAMVRRPRYNCRLRTGGELSLVVPGCNDSVATAGTERAAKRDVILSEQQSSFANVNLCVVYCILSI